MDLQSDHRLKHLRVEPLCFILFLWSSCKLVEKLLIDDPDRTNIAETLDNTLSCCCHRSD